MNTAVSPGIRVFSTVLMLLGISLWAVYLVYLPMPQWFQSDAALQQAGVVEPGMIFYCLATAGAALVVWGKLLAAADQSGVDRPALLSASALGMLLLGVMRLGTSLFPHGPFQQLLILPISECIVFTLIAWFLFSAAKS